MPKSPTSKRPKSPSTRNPENDSAAEIAKALGVSKGRVHQLLRAGMPHTVDAALSWRADRGESAGAADALRAERVRLVRAQADKAEVDLAERRGELVKASEAFAAGAAVGAGMKLRLLQMQNDMPPRLEGLTATAMIPIFRQEIARVLESVSEERFFDQPAVRAIVALADEDLAAVLAQLTPG